MATVLTVAPLELERTSRIDPEYYLPDYQDLEDRLKRLKASPLTDVAKVSDGNHASISKHFTSSGVRYLRGQDINDFFISAGSPVYLPLKTYNSAPMLRSHMQPLDVLVSIVGTIGAVALLPADAGPVTGSCKIAILRSRTVDPYYLAAFLLSRYGQMQMRRLTRGALQMGLILDDFDQIKVPTPSPELVELVTSRIEMAQAERRSADKAFGSTVKSSLVQLNLADSPSNYGANHLSLERSKVRSIGRLDPEFFLAREHHDLRERISSNMGTLDEVCDRIASGVTPAKEEYTTQGVPILKVEGLDSIGTARHTDGFVSAEWAARNPKAAVQAGDVLMLSAAHAASYIGKSGVVVDELPAEARVVAELINLRSTTVPPEALAIYLNLPPVRSHVRGLIRGSTAHLYPRDLKQVPVPDLTGDLGEELTFGFQESHKRQRSARTLLQEAVTAVEIELDALSDI
ncbi:hypothetical protein [Micromonospora globbae]|uniref:hypothetical protein n=1 Tax=Micromonospora globbae TaxID=1894969 RepID=UPI0011C34BE5|nr:hypothetical protein [Micromonospora globbae]